MQQICCGNGKLVETTQQRPLLLLIMNMTIGTTSSVNNN